MRAAACIANSMLASSLQMTTWCGEQAARLLPRCKFLSLCWARLGVYAMHSMAGWARMRPLCPGAEQRLG